MVELKDVRKGFRRAGGEWAEVLRIGAFRVDPGEQVALVGPSGSGKTTLLHILCGLLLPDEGEVRVDGVRLDMMGEAARDRWRGRRVGVVHQGFHLLAGYTVEENIEIAMRFGAGLDRERAAALLLRVGLAGFAKQPAGSLSVGQKQRVALARALANHPALVLADEPSASLDPPMARLAMELLQETCRENHAALLVVTHDERALGNFRRVERLDSLTLAPEPCP